MSIRAQAVRSFLISAAALAVAAPAWAQTQPEEQAQDTNQATEASAEEGDVIIVTATKRASTLQDVPFSVNAQTQEDIERANAGTIEDIARNVAGLTVQNLGPGQSQVSVRGVSAGQVVRDQPGVKEQVGVYLDESVISLSLFTPDFDLFDLNRVETLRGPQGTLFGAGSVGGTVRYITNQPRLGRTEGQFEAGLNSVADGGIGGHIKGAINLPFGDNAAARLVAYFTKYAGFIDAIGPAGGKDVNDGARSGVRLSVLMQPTDALKITPRLVYQVVNSHGFNREEFYNLYFNQFTTEGSPDGPGKRTQYLKLREKFRDETLLGDLTVSYDFGGAELTSVSSYIDRDILVSRDASALTGSVSVDLGFPPAGIDLASNLRDTTELSQFNQEVRLSSTGSGPFQWVFGGFLSNVDRVYAQRLPTPGYDEFTDLIFGPGTSAAVDNGFGLVDNPYHANLPYDIRQRAIFGEGSYDFGQFKLTAGGRYYKFKEERRFHSGGLFSNLDDRVDSTKSNGFSPRGIVTWEPNNNLSVNVQAAKGFRLGGVNDPLNVPLCSDEDEEIFGSFQTYDDETLWNYEAGVKYSRRGITFNAAVFYNDIKNLQVTLDAGSCSSRIVFNVPKAHSKGIEAEFSASPLEGLDLSLAGTLINSEFDSTVTTGAGVVIGGIEEGNRLPSVAKYTIAASATYGVPISDTGEFYVNANVQRTGNRYTQPSDQEPAGTIGLTFFDPETGVSGVVPTAIGELPLGSYTLVNGSVGVEWDSGFEIVGYVKNLFDVNPKLSVDRERGLRARIGYNVGTPRTIGLTFRKKFASAPRVAVAPPPPPPPLPAAPMQTCPDGSVIAADAVCPPPPAQPAPPPPATPERG